MAKKRKRRSRRGSKLTQSYNAYKANRKKWISKGYTMEEQLSKKEYKKYYEQAKQLGEQNIAREFAQAERMYSMREAQRLRKEAIDQGFEKEDLPTVKEIIGTSSRKEIFDWWLDNIAEGDYSRRAEFEAIYG
ncbi:MAG: hypothetical protein J6S85_15995 [Methanobrevibacter sp.]|nr:hypothetical protein [Methanobrevibacter sp.]